MVFLNWSNDSSAAVERKNWLMEQACRAPVLTKPGQTRHQLGIGATHWIDDVSVRGFGLIDFKVLEVGVQASQRLFLKLTRDAGTRRAVLEPTASLLGAEIARSFVTRSRHFGRLGVGFFRFLPTVAQWIGFSMTTGILPQPEAPWSLTFQGNLLFGLRGQQSFVLASAETERLLHVGTDSSFGVGGRVAWANRSNDPNVPGRYEFMQFTLSPFVDWRFAMGKLELALDLRIWLDREVRADGSKTEPSDFSAPALSALWAVIF